MDHADWNRGLLLGGLLIVIAVMALVSGRSMRDRLLAAGVAAQGIVMTFVAGTTYYPRAELEVAALVLAVLCCLWSVWIFHDGRTAADRARASNVDPIELIDPLAPIMPSVALETPNDEATASGLREPGDDP